MQVGQLVALYSNEGFRRWLLIKHINTSTFTTTTGESFYIDNKNDERVHYMVGNRELWANMTPLKSIPVPNINTSTPNTDVDFSSAIVNPVVYYYNSPPYQRFLADNN